MTEADTGSGKSYIQVMVGYPRFPCSDARWLTTMAGRHLPLIPGVPTKIVGSKLPAPLIEAFDEYLLRIGANRSSVVRSLVEELLEREAPELLRQRKLVA